MQVPVLLNLHLPRFGPAHVGKGMLVLGQPGLSATDYLCSGSSRPWEGTVGKHGWPRMTRGLCVLAGCFPQMLLVPGCFLKLALPSQSLVWDFSPYVSYMSRHSWLAGHPHTISHGDLKFTMFQTELIISFLPRPASVFLSWWMKYSAPRLPKLQCLESSLTPPSCLPWVNQRWFYFINIPYTHALLWILCHCSGLGLHHFFSRFAFASLLISLPRVFKAEKAIGILGRTAGHWCKMVPGLCDF